ncbi:type II toxin-antitoxin system VapC family toxin [Planomonospora sp. ID67723]|uniref:type II toxin-antitoxin system VapC family toxin n=1 Tax=Planomonospora sp. ID67723 TaxID=2738134 RepID=UPI0018C43FEC|nr:type II toxin-antitoxin system VapC family toxin [Planomonospora sp. ID67723]MBG0828812.1 type II toxin-antitoxin system VapC family toxin [Planomonospora sp. ID67723]
MLTYIGSSVLACAYLPDEPGHRRARDLIESSDHLLVTGTLTVVEVTGVLVRASRAHRLLELDNALAVLASDLGEDGPVTLVAAARDSVELRATEIVYTHALRALDALHLAVAELAAVPLLDSPGDKLGFASRDISQSEAALALGFIPV